MAGGQPRTTRGNCEHGTLCSRWSDQGNLRCVAGYCVVSANRRRTGISPFTGVPPFNTHAVPPKLAYAHHRRVGSALICYTCYIFSTILVFPILALSLPCILDDWTVLNPTGGQPSLACTPHILQRTHSGGDEYSKIWLVVFRSVRGMAFRHPYQVPSTNPRMASQGMTQPSPSVRRAHFPVQWPRDRAHRATRQRSCPSRKTSIACHVLTLRY